MLNSLCEEHEFVVFAIKFDNPRPDRINFIRIPVPNCPLAVMFLLFHILAATSYIAARIRGVAKFDCIQFVESNLLFRGLVYAHFCHGTYLERHWIETRPSGLRRFGRWLDHRLHALAEPFVLSRARKIIVPSQGLAGELGRRYPESRGRIGIIANPVDQRHFAPPPGLDRPALRRQLGLGPDRITLCFIALGHFERKGLGLAIDAIARLADPRVELIVVGGTPQTVMPWQRHAERARIGHCVTFFGMQQDIRPYLWCADAFILPSFYEVYPLVGLQAAAAQVPLIATPVHGLNEFMIHRENGLIIQPTVDSIVEAISEFLGMSAQERRAMGQAAAKSIAHCSEERFAENWRSVYREMGAA
ncbi:MAG TPA: glycosyltransferase family 4 protein [Alphaproteobacteria bacterium]|nr:glycosyltransferase family 4 protein [Alphaproteobacteria bacterium]